MVCHLRTHFMSLPILGLTYSIYGHAGNSQSNLDDGAHGASSEDQGLNQSGITNPLAASPSTFMSTSDGRTCLSLLYLSCVSILLH